MDKLRPHQPFLVCSSSIEGLQTIRADKVDSLLLLTKSIPFQESRTSVVVHRDPIQSAVPGRGRGKLQLRKIRRSSGKKRGGRDQAGRNADEK